MTPLLPHRSSGKLKSKTIQFEEYKPPRRRPRSTGDEEEGPELETEDSSGAKSTSEPEPEPEGAPSARATRAWKVVDAKTILTKRQYIRRRPPKSSSAAGGSDSSKELHRAAPAPPTAFPDDAPRSVVRWSPGGGKLQGVSFNVLPHTYSPSVQAALDFLIHDIGQAAMPAALHAIGFSPKAHAFIHLGFEHPTFFHAVIAFAQGYKEVATTGATEPSSVVLYHRGMATRGLYARLKDPKTCADDISILITFLLIDNVWRYGENEIGQKHYAGLLKMVETRGGLDQLGISGILKAMIDFAEVTDIGDSLRSPITIALPDLRYYSHPFPANICGLISRLPKGYAEIALQGQLSIETIATIVSFSDWLSSDPTIRSPAPHRQIGAARRCLAASKPPGGGIIEEAVCFGIIITSMRSFHARFSRMDHSFLDRIVELGQEFDGSTIRNKTSKNVESEHIAFLTLVAVEASEKCIELQSHVKTLVDLLIKREKFARSWDGMEMVTRKFFWVPFAIDSWRACWLRQLKRRAEAKAVAEARERSQSADEAAWNAVIDPALV